MNTLRSTPWPHPDSLDALLAAPKHHSLIFENDRVRALEVRIPPGDFVPVHTHRWPAVMHISSAAHFIRRDADANVTLDTRTVQPPPQAPVTIWSDALPPHSVENVGDSEIRILSIEIKE